MQHGKKSPTERIAVTDQVGKRHVVVRYEDVDTSPEDADQRDNAERATEYRLATGMSVDKTGPDTFQTADGRLQLKVL